MSENRSQYSPETLDVVRKEFMPRSFRELYEVSVEPLPNTNQHPVYRATYKKDAHPVAVKFVPLDEIDGGFYGIKEIHLACTRLLGSHSPYVLPYEDIVYDDILGVGLVTRWMPGGNLEMKMKDVQKNIDTASSCAMQIALGIGELERIGIVHRDLKPSNIFLEKQSKKDRFPLCVVADFGLSAPREYLQQHKENERRKLSHLDEFDLWERRGTSPGFYMGTDGWMSPEQLRDDDIITPSSDIFVLGSIMHTLCVGYEPFAGYGEILRKELSQDIFIPDNDHHKKIKERLYVIIYSLLQKDVAKRGVLPDGRRLMTGDDVARAIAECWVGSGSDIEQTVWFRDVLGMKESISY